MFSFLLLTAKKKRRIRHYRFKKINQIHRTIHNKRSKKSINISYDNIINDFDISSFPIPIFNEDDNITGYINTADDKEDNPTLITFKLVI